MKKNPIVTNLTEHNCNSRSYQTMTALIKQQTQKQRLTRNNNNNNNNNSFLFNWPSSLGYFEIWLDARDYMQQVTHTPDFHQCFLVSYFNLSLVLV